MKIKFIIIPCLFLLLFIQTLAGCSSTPKYQSKEKVTQETTTTTTGNPVFEETRTTTTIESK